MLDIDVDYRVGQFTLNAHFKSDARVTALFGHSGTGKTTLINIIAGLVRPERGHVRIDGETLLDRAHNTDVPPFRRRIGYVFQDERLFPHLNVRHNLTYG